ncbi:hypothetical protein T484DRAFT_1783584 [Baffinella frigidus]|nr:hypothetical protein T484DRAFT_1783584 [Cryptophyta sp. CCMP2293]
MDRSTLLLGAIVGFVGPPPAATRSRREGGGCRSRGIAVVYGEKKCKALAVITSSTDHIPPLPDEVKALLAATTLCHLSCRDDESGAPHTSLMNFTFVSETEDVLVMATRRDTRKFVLMQQHRAVSVMLHDFPQQQPDEVAKPGAGSFKRTLSISLSGMLRIEDGAQAERFRALHLAANPNYANFIEGDDKAIVTVKITRARMCNIEDKVTTWNAKNDRGHPI